MQKNVIRIIGGIYKRTKLDILDICGLRPTPDRLRETLFNWLGDLNDVKCLDLFAGSGALGFECLSRGAKDVTFVEKDRQIFEKLNLMKDKLKLDEKANFFNQDSIKYLTSINSQIFNSKFDLIFIDPPYSSNLLEKSLELSINILSKDGKIYIESNKNLEQIIKDNNLSILKHIKMGQIFAYLIKV